MSAVSNRRLGWLIERFTVGTLVGGLGAGMFIPFSLLYFTQARSIPLPVVSVGLAVGAGVTLACAYPLGVAVDRLGAKRVLVLANMGRAVIFGLFAFVPHAPTILVLLILNCLLERGSWVALYTVIGRSPSLFGASGALRFARLSWLRNVGLGVGALVAAVLASDLSLMVVAVWANAVSYIIAGLCFMASGAGAGAQTSSESRKPGEAAPVRLAFGRVFWLVVVVKLFLVIIAGVFGSFLPVVADTYFSAAWLAGIGFSVNTWMIIFLQPWIIKRAQKFSPAGCLILGASIYVASGAVFVGAAVLPDVARPWMFLAGVVVFTIGEILVAPSSDQLADSALPSEVKGRGQSIYQSAWGVGGVFAPVLGGFVVIASSVGFGALLLFLALLGLGCGLIVVRALRRARVVSPM
ncbi:MFS transporter [Falsarthrobacter nasiphocae]|uniref:MFS family permease n=1 Tax=Falsarthrobacter nasiphocae TaxID=189863 RepID=A0AAE3YIK6_9MICC|nr:MFS transporter [Falsarthrobacter nasiphocae]MDR6892932.1 MFS family permease [Falsarthrobacter nasiphocae]